MSETHIANSEDGISNLQNECQMTSHNDEILEQMGISEYPYP